jgi:methylated-DNA-[protein]-cysteine S-methyltransferase
VLTEAQGRIIALDWAEEGAGEGGGEGGGASPLLDTARRQLDEYFAGRRRRFTLPLAPVSTPFQHGFFEALMAIPFGETRTYGELARVLEVPAQAVGQACGANPIPILIPCHRVLGASGPGGYSGRGGVETKLALLRLEGAVLI